MAERQLTYYEAQQDDKRMPGRAGQGRQPPPPLPPAIGRGPLAGGGKPGGKPGGKAGKGGLAHSATAIELRRHRRSDDASAGGGTTAGAAGGATAADPRPISAPGDSAATSLGASASAGGLPAAGSFELSEAMERQMLENQRLREALLHFTSKPAQGKRSKGGGSLGMPLPPV